MHCPVCHTAMVTFEVDGVEVDHCIRCRGVWLDRGELAILAGGEEDDEIARLAPAPEVTEGLRDCPICDRPMEKTRAGDSGVIVDRCRRADGIWLDAGELDAVLGLEAGNGRVQRLLAELFGPPRGND